MHDTQQLTDPRPLLDAEMDRIATTIWTLTSDQLDQPTQCPGWTVRDIVAHLIAVADRITSIGRGEPAVGEVSHPDLSDTEWLSAFTTAAAASHEQWLDDALLGQMVSPPFGQMPGAIALSVYVNEVIVHHWDILDATGVTTTWDDATIEAGLAGVAGFLPPAGRSEVGIPFSDAVPVPPDAAPIDRLVAYLGRRP